jgi:hypothetical protein
MLTAHGRAALQRLEFAERSRLWARALTFQASGYSAAGVAAPAVVDELLELHVCAIEYGRPSQWPA